MSHLCFSQDPDTRVGCLPEQARVSTESRVEIHPMDGRTPERERHTSHSFHDLKALLRGWPEGLKSYGMP